MRSITIDADKLTAYITAAQSLQHATDELLQAIIDSVPAKDEWLTANEAAEITKLSTTFLRQLAIQGRISGSVQLGKVWRFSRIACEQMFQNADVVSPYMPDRGRRRK